MGLMTSEEFRGYLAALRDHADELRRAGVRRLAIGELSFELAEPQAAPIFVTDDERRDEPADALDDPLTFGNRSFVPGLMRRDEESD